MSYVPTDSTRTSCISSAMRCADPFRDHKIEMNSIREVYGWEICWRILEFGRWMSCLVTIWARVFLDCEL